MAIDIYYYMCGHRKSPTKVVDSNIPELWQRLKWCLISKRNQGVKLLKVPKLKTKLGYCNFPVSWPGRFQPRLLIGQNLHQRRPTCSGCKTGFPHSSISSQSEQMSCEGLWPQASTTQVTIQTTLLRGATITKASLVEVTVPSTPSRKVPIILKASLVVTTLATATRKTATLPRTKEWKPKRYNKSDSL